MTALSLFDLAALAAQSQEPESSSAKEASTRLVKVAESMVGSAIQEFERVRALDETFAPATEDAGEDLIDKETSVVLRSMYEECAREAERVLARVQRIERQGHKIKDAQLLRDWHGRTMAMLSVSLDEIAESVQSAKQGKVISGTQVRNELRARLNK